MSTITLRRHQVEAADAVEAAFRAGINRPLLDMCVGSGKSLTMAELARRAIGRGERVLILAHTRELVEQNANACRLLGLETGVNAAALGERTWRAPVISAAIQSVYKSPQAFGPIQLVLGDECHLWPHSESGMYRQLARALPYARIAGASGTVFRLQGGSLVEGEGAPFDRVVYTYSILDGIRDGYLVPAFSAKGEDAIDTTKLKVRSGEFTNDSQDAQMIAAMDNHIVQMQHHGADRRAWLVFEASAKAATAMAERMNAWGIPTGLVLGETGAGERANTIDRFRRGELRALVNRDVLTTGFDVQQVDMLVMRRATKSLGLYVQMTGRLLRTIGGKIESSTAGGKADGIVLDFAGNIDRHGPLDFLRPKDTKARFVKCESCNARCPSAAMKCWSCSATMMKNCPACLEPIARYELDCPHCAYDMRSATGERKDAKLLDLPSGAALISSWRGQQTERAGGWLPITKAWGSPGGALVDAAGSRIELRGALAETAREARWIRHDGTALLVPNGSSRTSAWQVTADGAEIKRIIVPLPATADANNS